MGYNSRIEWEMFIMENQWSGFDDFELACLCHDYGFEDLVEIESILPVKLKNRSQIEKFLTEYEMAEAFGE
jgi:hypothetical protein